MSNWVRFHEELTRDDKLGLSRATRFIYMELSLRARAKRGWIPLPAAASDAKALRMILGGNTREVDEAVERLTSPADPMICFTDRDGKRIVEVLQWQKWNPKSDDTAARIKSWRKGKDDRSKTVECNVTSTVTETGSEQPVGARARALISSPLSLSLVTDLKIPGDPEIAVPSVASGAPESGLFPTSGERHLRLSEALTPELRAAAEMAAVQDIAGCWTKFCGHHADKWIHVAGRWQVWCANEAKRERTERERARAVGAAREAPADAPARRRIEILPSTRKANG